jgi:hypothetical protein
MKQSNSKIIFGFLIILLGITLEIMWISICFGTIIVGILLLIFAPRILFFPFNFFLAIGLTFIKGKDYMKNARQSKQQYSYQYSSNKNSYQSVNSFGGNETDKYYEILESKKGDSLEVIKTRYRKLMKEYHYDSIASKDLPQEMLDFAHEKSKSLNEAYSAIKKELTK